jgi:predicted AAA+ superfamily ATPase
LVGVQVTIDRMTLDPPSHNHITRRAEARVAVAIGDTRVVLVIGPRQAGKTTLVRRFTTETRPFVTLDDAQTLNAARADPVGFIRSLPSAIIDEVQRAPALMLAIKETVDRDTSPGRYLLTGSANVMALPSIGDSLAGRIEIIQLLPLSQAELIGSSGSFLDRMFAGDQPVAGQAPAYGKALVDRVLAGGYPEPLRRSPARQRAWFRDYLKLVLDRDVRDTADIEQLGKLPTLVAMLAEHSGQLVNLHALSMPLELSRPTIQKYVTVLERLFLLQTIRPWYSNRLSRLIKTPKMHFLDSGLLSALRDANAEAFQLDRTGFGPLLETFVASEIMKLLSWTGRSIRLSHFRTKDFDEVDLVLEDSRGRIVGIEVKASATLRSKDFSGLVKLQDAAGDKFVRGLVLHDHDRVTPHSEKIQGAPVSVLWEM